MLTPDDLGSHYVNCFDFGTFLQLNENLKREEIWQGAQAENWAS